MGPAAASTSTRGRFLGCFLCSIIARPCPKRPRPLPTSGWARVPRLTIHPDRREVPAERLWSLSPLLQLREPGPAASEPEVHRRPFAPTGPCSPTSARDQVEVVPFLEAALADVPRPVSAGRPGNGSRDHQARIAPLDEAGSLEALGARPARSAAPSAPGREEMTCLRGRSVCSIRSRV